MRSSVYIMKPLLLIVLLCVQASLASKHSFGKRKRALGNTTTTESPQHFCNVDQLEYRVAKLEVQVAEKSKVLLDELKETNHKITALGSENLEGVREALNSLLVRDPQTTDNNFLKLEQQLEYISKGLHLLVAAIRGANSDIAYIKRILWDMVNNTEETQHESKNLANEGFLIGKLWSVRHNKQNYHSHDYSSHREMRSVPGSCRKIQEARNVSGIYHIYPEYASKPFMVICDMELRGGGWTYILNRYEGSQDFYLNWDEYKQGFGNLAGEFWLGLEHIYEMTGNTLHELLVELTDVDLQTKYAHYSAFSVGPETEGFPLKVLGGYEGDAGDSLSYHAGSRFSTKDVDHDGWNAGSCAQSHGGAWWYRSCDKSNLNGRFVGGGKLPEQYLYNGMYWETFRGPDHSLLRARMLIRPRDEHSPPIFPLRNAVTAE